MTKSKIKFFFYNLFSKKTNNDYIPAENISTSDIIDTNIVISKNLNINKNSVNTEKNLIIQNNESNFTAEQLNKFIVNSTNIIAMINTSLESLSIYLNREDFQDKKFKFIHKSIEDQVIACELLKMLVNKATIESNNLEPKITPVSIIQIIEKSINIIKILFVNKNIKYTTNITNTSRSSNKLYLTDGSWLHMIIMTLLTNAKKYTLEGTITVTKEILENSVRISVIDTGCGIRVDKRIGLFKKKQNIDSNNNLHLIYRMVTKLNGTCGYKPNINNNNNGSIFWIEIPSLTSQLSELSIADDISNKLNVIICDDSRVMVEIFTNYISRQIPKASISTTYNMVELLDRLITIDKNKIVVIILDIYLQDDFALNHLNSIKKVNKNVGVIIHTGSSMNDSEIQKYTSSINLAFSVMHKPASLKIIQNSVITVLQMMGCYNILVINEDIEQKDYIYNIFKEKSFSVLTTDNIIDARNLLFKMNGTPLIIFITTSIIKTIDTEIEQELSYIDSYKVIIDSNNTLITKPLYCDVSINSIDISINKIIDSSINKYCDNISN